MNKQSGYTLLETLIALVIFVGVVVPLLAYISGGKSQDRARELIIATCLLDQEVKKARFNTGDVPMIVSRNINGLEWQVKFSCSGAGLQSCNAGVYKNGKYITDAAFFRNASK
jgi:prepilin-type N-terminal cleavage/methylation domain-containing protein